MNLIDKIEALSQLGERIVEKYNHKRDAAILAAYQKNEWFTPDNSLFALESIASTYLDKAQLTAFVNNYQIPKDRMDNVALVMAGNIPLVGFHDVLCSFLSSNKSKIKYSSKDDVLLPYLLDELADIDPGTIAYFEKVDQLKDFQKVIATGGDAAAVHFNYYFAKYPHIIRKNRNSVAILDGNETHDDLIQLGADVFNYFGLGCRSVSKLYLPKGFDLDRIFTAFYEYKEIINHNKYKNNFDYNHAIYILGQVPFLTNDLVILKEDASMASRIACIHYEFYTDLDELIASISAQIDDIQCISSHMNQELFPWHITPLGQCQQPCLNDFADNVDTMQFLLNS